jgi:hypothetical protein
MKLRCLAVCCVTFFLISCARDNEELFLPDATITIYTPANATTIHQGDSIYINALATCATTLHGYELTIRKPGGPNLYFQHYHDHNDTLVIKDQWKNTVAAPAELELVMSIILDHEDHRKNVVVPLQVRN